MPFRQSIQIITIVGHVERLQPPSILDLGVGMPKDFIARNVESNPFENHRSHRSAPQRADHGFDSVIASDESRMVVSSRI